MRKLLTPREIECLAWIAQGKTYAEISIMLEISFASVKSHLDHARYKLGAVNLPHAIALAMAYGIIFMKDEAIVAREKIARENIVDKDYGEFGVAQQRDN